MGNIFESRITYDREEILNNIKYLGFEKEFLQEMGEPIILEDNQTWIFFYLKDKMVSFITYNHKKILYVYTLKEYRNKGLFDLMYKELPLNNWETIASNMSYPLFLKKGFKVIKNYKNCHKLKLTI